MPVKYVYILATLAALAIFLPFQDQRWAMYVGACAGYTTLLFVRRLRQVPLRRLGEALKNLLTADVLLTHATFLAIVIGWVWVLIVLAPHLPYALRTDDSDRPYFGLAFIGILGLTLLEMVEQRYIQPRAEPGDSHLQIAAVRRAHRRAVK
jgi:hypothetical protein